MRPDRLPVSIICVFNDAAVRAECLDTSIELHLHSAPETEYLPIDNTDGRFRSAGAALNHGVALARHGHVVLVHQDVYLHSLVALERAAAFLDAGDVAMLGALGVTADRRFIGRMRDRVVLIGESTRDPLEVDSLDEVLIVLARERLCREPLAEDPHLAWHAYAVEYAMRLRRQGARVGAVDLEITHNSLTTNLARLDEAHRFLAREYAELGPVRTTCGVVDPGTQGPPRPKRFARHRWRLRWLRDSLVARRSARASGAPDVVLSDIRLDIDELLAASAPGSLLVANLAPELHERPLGEEVLVLRRHDATVAVQAVASPAMIDLIARRPQDHSLLCTNLGLDDLRVLSPHLGNGPVLLGVHDDAGSWLLVGPAAAARVPVWSTAKARPLGQRRRRAG